MISPRTIRLLPGLWVAWIENDFLEISDVALGLWQRHAEVRSLRKHDRRWS